MQSPNPSTKEPMKAITSLAALLSLCGALSAQAPADEFAPPVDIQYGLKSTAAPITQAFSGDARFADISAFEATGDLWHRQTLSFSRLEQGKYLPENVFQHDYDNWPGDTEGRTFLAWTLLEQATHRRSRYLSKVLEMWDNEVNAKGYFGKIYTDGISEQQLASHGWVLRALSEFQAERPDSRARELAAPIVENLFLPTTCTYREYPIDPPTRKSAGSYSGSKQGQIGAWIISSDIGCYAIGMAGAIDAYLAFGDERLVPLIDEMVDRFLQIDFVHIKAQTHATLSGLRGQVRWAKHTRDEHLWQHAEAIFQLYTEDAWTETYANYNWFGRPTWTEPCAVVDSLMVAMELFLHTGKETYLEDAQLIYFNALGHGQRANGGFGCDNCPGADGTGNLSFKVKEARWCCTMRGAEGLSRMNNYQAVIAQDGEVLLPFGLPGSLREGTVDLEIATDYPQYATWKITNRGQTSQKVALYIPSWIAGIKTGWARFELATGESTSITGTLAECSRPLLASAFKAPPNETDYKGATIMMKGPLIFAQYGQDDWQPIFYDYLRGDMSIEHSSKLIIAHANKP